MKTLSLAPLFLLLAIAVFAQNNSSDSLINALMNDHTTPSNDAGLTLIKSGNYEGATDFFSSEINKDESDRQAYFRRGVANWALSDTLNACRDWSSVLALGDTEMFNLLDGRCHGSMIISDDTIPSKQYRKMWSKKDGDQVSGKDAKTVVDEMPQFIGGENKLFEYLSTNIKKPKDAGHGTVYINFLINPKGKVLYPYIAHSLSKECDKEAIRLIRSMPAWKPGKLKGKAVYVRSSLPVRF